MATPFDAWENIIATEVNGAPLPTMIDAVREAAIEFCAKTRIDTRIVAGVDIEAAYPETAVPDKDPNVFPGSIINVWSTYGRIVPKTRRELEALYPDGWAGESVATTYEVKFWHALRPGVVRLVPYVTTDMAAELTIEVAFQPRRNAIACVDWLYELYAKEIGYGAIGALHTHSGAPYAQPERAASYRGWFEQRMSELADRGVAGHAKPRHRVAADELS
jgi:hypothetical protein